jgi:esterase/lipase
MEKITFKNQDGLNLIGMLHVSSDGSKSKAVIIAHGFTSNKDRERHIKLSNTLSENGITAFRIDFGGSGESDDRGLTVKGQVGDLHSAVSYLQKEGYKNIGVLGESLGGLTALIAFNEDIKAMVLWAPVTQNRYTEVLSDEHKKSMEDNGYYIKHKDGRDLKIPEEYAKERKSVNRKEMLGNINIPILIVHGTADTTIPIKDSEEAIKLLLGGSRLETIKNLEYGNHKMNADMDTVIPITLRWFQEHFEI